MPVVLLGNLFSTLLSTESSKSGIESGQKSVHGWGWPIFNTLLIRYILISSYLGEYNWILIVSASEDNSNITISVKFEQFDRANFLLGLDFLGRTALT